MSVTWQGNPVVLGGWRTEGTNPKVATDRVWRVVNSRWVELPPLLQPRAAAAAAVVGDRIIVTGGVDANGKLLNTTEIFDGNSWTLGAEMPTPRQMLSAASDGKRGVRRWRNQRDLRPDDGRGVRPGREHMDDRCPTFRRHAVTSAWHRRRTSRGGRGHVRRTSPQERGGA